MPYQTNQELPDSVKSSLPDAAQSIFREAFNSAVYDQQKSEEDATRMAWGAVENAGYKQGQDGAYHMMNLAVNGIVMHGDKGQAPAQVLFDTGASLSFVARKFAEKIATILPLPQAITVQVGDSRSLEITEQAVLAMATSRGLESDTFLVMPDLLTEVVLGLTSLRKFQVKMDLGRDAIMALIQPQRKGFAMKDFLKKLFTVIGVSSSEDEITEEKAVELIQQRLSAIKQEAKPPISTPLATVQKIIEVPARTKELLGLDPDATEAQVNGKILALKSPGNQVPTAEYNQLSETLREREIADLVAVACSPGADEWHAKLYPSEREWAAAEAKKDFDTMREFIRNRPKVLAIMDRLPKKKSTDVVIDDTQASINAQLKVDEATFKKYNTPLQ